MMKSLCRAPTPVLQDLSRNECSYKVRGNAFLFSFLPKSICLVHKEGSEQVIITHHALESMKVTFSNKPRVCGGCSKHYIIAAASIPTINTKKQRQNGSSPRSCHNLRGKQNPKSSWRQLPLFHMLRHFCGEGVMFSVQTIFHTFFQSPGNREQTGRWRWRHQKVL